MANPNFTEILNKPMSETERPKPLPAGTYLCTVQGQPEFDKSKQKGTPFVRFTLAVLQPQDDVSPDHLANISGGVQGKTVRSTYYLTEDALWRLKDFLVNCGIEEGIGYNEAIASAPGNQVLVKIRHRSSEDGSQVFAEVESTAKA